jgi:hypothetical protein
MYDLDSKALEARTMRLEPPRQLKTGHSSAVGLMRRVDGENYEVARTLLQQSDRKCRKTLRQRLFDIVIREIAIVIRSKIPV